ncbi:hypothetical protein ALC53_04107 [Atta colombica]|uniref:Uncharacterized protein n=1 Tax=Atta colombica TaxID=520822 RepID=A0A195BL63_9HYME|nr:hypothetical protein ALC53_04107 [Atta colombica]
MYIAQSRYTLCKKSDPVSLPIKRNMLCVQTYMCRYCNRNATKVCPVPRALSPWYSTTYEHANYPKEFASVHSFRVSKDLPLSVISFREFSSRISVRQKLHHCVNAIIKREEHYYGLCN